MSKMPMTDRGRGQGLPFWAAHQLGLAQAAQRSGLPSLVAPVGHLQEVSVQRNVCICLTGKPLQALQPLGSEVRVELLWSRGAQGCGAGGLIVSSDILNPAPGGGLGQSRCPFCGHWNPLGKPFVQGL